MLVLAVLASPSLALAADTTPPTSPGQPKEGSPSVDTDFDADGSYSVYWPAARDPQSGISAYRVQERIGATGSWITLTSTRTAANWPVSGRLDKKTYYYRVQAKNKAGLWGPLSPASDGILIDKTPPSQGAVTDDGAWTASTSTLHAAWTAGSDPESGIAQYEYLICQDSIPGTVLVNYTSVGSSMEVTRTGLNLVHGKKYFVGVRAKNQAGLYSSTNYSDGIGVDKNAPLIGTAQPADGSTYTEGNLLGITVSAVDPDGDTLQYQFLLDGAVQQAWGAASSWSWNTAGVVREHPITIQVRDIYGRQTDQVLKLFGYRRPRGTP